MFEIKEKEKKYSTDGPVISEKGKEMLARILFEEWLRCTQEKKEEKTSEKI